MEFAENGLRKVQAEVAEFSGKCGLASDPVVRFLDFSSELGELSKELLKSSGYGERELCVTQAMEEEAGDCLFSLLAFCNAAGIDGEKALSGVLQKYEERFEKTGQTGSGR